CKFRGFPKAQEMPSQARTQPSSAFEESLQEIAGFGIDFDSIPYDTTALDRSRAMSRKTRRIAKAKKQAGADGDLNDSRTANIGRKRKRSDHAIDVAWQDAKRARLEEEDPDYVRFQTSAGSVTDESGEQSTSPESGEVDSNASPRPSGVITRHRSGSASDNLSTAPLSASSSDDIDVASLRPRYLRDEVAEVLTRRPESSALQILEDMLAGHPNLLLRKKAQHALKFWRQGRIANGSSDLARSSVTTARLDGHSEASDGGHLVESSDSKRLGRKPRTSHNIESRSLDASSLDAEFTDLPAAPESGTHIWTPADMGIEDVPKGNIRAATQAVLATHVDWTVHMALSHMENAATTLKTRRGARGALRNWPSQHGLPESGEFQPNGMPQRARSAMFRSTPVTLKDVEPEVLQTAMRTHMRKSQKGMSSPEVAIREVLNGKHRALRKHAATYLMAQHHMCEQKLESLFQVNLASIVSDIESFNAPLDIAALLAITEKSPRKSERLFGRALRKRCSKQQGIPAAEHLYGLMVGVQAQGAYEHILACEAMHQYLLDHVIDAAPIVSNTKPSKDGLSLLPCSRAVASAVTEDAKKGATESAQPGLRTETPPLANGSPSDKGLPDSEPEEMIDSRFLCLSDLSPEDQALQYRYFGISDLGDSPYCLCCGEQDHHERACPAAVCQHCHSNTHFSRRCPSHQKCERCRQRGHSSVSCSNHSKVAGAPGDECDVCGKRGHAEEQCTELWTTFKIDAETFVPVSRESIVVSCYNCGKANDHWGDDCKTLPDYVIKDIMHDTWSANNADRYVLAAEKTAGRHPGDGEVENMHARDGGIQAHQLAQLGDWL
ncbi:hypothetical protein LTR95_008790, partial [Oleoguttula sp. CCFEE 5521]